MQKVAKRASLNTGQRQDCFCGSTMFYSDALQNPRGVSFGKDLYVVVKDLIMECKCGPFVLLDLSCALAEQVSRSMQQRQLLSSTNQCG